MTKFSENPQDEIFINSSANLLANFLILMSIMVYIICSVPVITIRKKYGSKTVVVKVPSH